jgi:hypothetical protein
VRRSVQAEPVLHPESGKEWLQKLTQEQQAGFHSVHQRSADQDLEIAATVRRRWRATCMHHAALLAVMDAFSPAARC